MCLLTVAFTCWQLPAALAAPILVFSNEINEQNANKMVLDTDDTGGDVTLQFGTTLNEQLYWNNAGTTFVFTDDVNITGNLDVDGTITSGSSDITITNAAGNVDGEQIADNTIDEDSIDWGTGAGQISSTDLTFEADTVVTTSVGNGSGTTLDEANGAGDNGATLVGVDQTELTNSSSTNVQDVLDDLDAAISGGSHTQNTDTSTTSNTFTLDVDDTGGDVTLQFGATLAEQMYWDNAGSTFAFTDDVAVTGNITATGNIDIEGTLTTGSSGITITNAAGNIDGEQIAAGTIDQDSIDFTSITSTDLTFDADTVGTTAVFSGTTSLEETNAGGDSGADIIGVDNTALSNVSSGTVVQTALEELDSAITTNASNDANSTKTINISISDTAVLADGTANLADIYIDTDTGDDPHQYYVMKTTQGTLQDLDLKIKIQLPADFVDFSSTNDLSFDYKTTTTLNTENKIDILVEDNAGVDSFTAADGLAKVSAVADTWYTWNDEFDAGTYAAGDFIYVTIKGYGITAKYPYMGELVISYMGTN